MTGGRAEADGLSCAPAGETSGGLGRAPIRARQVRLGSLRGRGTGRSPHHLDPHDRRPGKQPSKEGVCRVGQGSQGPLVLFRNDPQTGVALG
jgi:hypothetical protein